MNRRAYTLIEVLMALAILAILAVPLAYILVQSGEGSSRARSLDDALDLVREDWTLCRSTRSDSLRDTTWERRMASGQWRVVRDVFDSSDRAGAGLATIHANKIGLHPPVEIASCATVRDGDAWDTVRCFRWLRPRWSGK